MTNGTLETIDGRPALRFERRLRHPATRVWRAVTDPAELACWFVAPVAWTPALGETFGGEGQTGEIIALDAPRLLAWTWAEERYRFELVEEAPGPATLLVFTHVFDPRHGSAAQHAAGWEAYLDRLDAPVDGGHMSEERAHEPIGVLHERYAALFGQDPRPGRRMIASMAFRDLELEDDPVLRLRFARHYRHAIERVWRAISEPQELARWFAAGEPLEVLERVAPRLLIATWFGDALRFELTGDGDGCRLVFTHEFAVRDTAARTAAGWDRCFARFDALLAERPMSEADSLELWQVFHERYAQTSGVDPELGRRAFAGHPLT